MDTFVKLSNPEGMYSDLEMSFRQAVCDAIRESLILDVKEANVPSVWLSDKITDELHQGGFKMMPVNKHEYRISWK